MEKIPNFEQPKLELPDIGIEMLDLNTLSYTELKSKSKKELIKIYDSEDITIDTASWILDELARRSDQRKVNIMLFLTIIITIATIINVAFFVYQVFKK